MCYSDSVSYVLQAVPSMANKPMIKLQSSDGDIFEVDVEIAKASNTIKTMIEGPWSRQGFCLMCCCKRDCV